MNDDKKKITEIREEYKNFSAKWWSYGVDITKEYIKPDECIILNVSSVCSGLPSIRTSRSIDNREERTLAVITKCDQFLHSDLSRAIAKDKFKIRSRYHFIRNIINDETHEEARIQETTLFETRNVLSKIEKSMSDQFNISILGTG
ncbi:hypothetical protein L2E82_39641 [Cichorium intybus]|uniref:Uncharacterized protein n=1 Tax=Cichorium intybus TaxID=13427 RepID=A0ACB9AJ43_CICIN|nr:hypothetical protein L2E82_39641 [Cichorium intybus]